MISQRWTPQNVAGLIGVLLCISVGRVQAQTAVVATAPCSESGTARWAALTREAVSQRPGMTVLDSDETAGRVGGLPRGSFADAQRLIRGSRMDLFADTYERAELTLRKAIEDLVRLPPSDAKWQELSDAWTMLAQIKQRTQRETQAEETIRRVLRVDRGYVPDESYYPPGFRRFVDGVRRKVDADAVASLRITTRPSGLTVFVDGRPVGPSPITLPVPPGTYRVEAAFASARGAARFVRVERSSAIELDSEFEGAIHPSFGPCIESKGGREARLVALVRLAGVLGVQLLIAVREEEPAPGERYLVASAVDASTGEEMREGRVRMYGTGLAPGAIERLAEFLATGTAAPPVQPIVNGKLTSELPKQDPEVPLARVLVSPQEPVPELAQRSRVPAWVATVGAATLLSVASWQGVGALQSSRELNSLRSGNAYMPGTEMQVQNLNDRIVRQRSLSIGIAAGGVASTVAAFLLFSWSGEFEEVQR